MRTSRLCALALAGLLGLAEMGRAAQLADVVAAHRTLEERRDRDSPAFEQEIRRIESEFIILLDQAPDDPKILDELSRFYGSGAWFARAPSPLLLDLVARSKDPVRLAERLASQCVLSASEEVLFARPR